MIKFFLIILVNIYRGLIPKGIRILIKKIFKFIYYKFRKIKLICYLRFTKKDVNLILGAALTKQKGWFSTNEEWLNIAKKRDWEKLFSENRRVKRVVAEHVFEHLTIEEMRNAFKYIFKYMVNGGSMRIAVPDGNNPNDEYIKYCGINGIGADASDHKQFISFEVLREEAEKVGFKVLLLEGYKSSNQLISKKFSNEYGEIMRSRNNQKSKNNNKQGWNFKDSHTSLIVDCFK